MVNKEGHKVRIGPLLKSLFDKQKDRIKQATYDCVKSSDYDAGEIIAKKIIANKLL